MLWRSPVHDQMVGEQSIDEVEAVWYPSREAFLGLNDVATAAKSFTLKQQVVESAVIDRCGPY